jgi:hypothetical protein
MIDKLLLFAGFCVIVSCITLVILAESNTFNLVDWLFLK